MANIVAEDIRPLGVIEANACSVLITSQHAPYILLNNEIYSTLVEGMSFRIHHNMTVPDVLRLLTINIFFSTQEYGNYVDMYVFHIKNKYHLKF